MTLPGNADLGRPGATKLTLDSISCPSFDSCVAVGSYSTSGGLIEPLSVVQTGMYWTQPSIEISLPPGADTATQTADLHSIACSGAGSCQAVGWYTDASGITEPMVATATDGTWTQPAAISVPANATAPAAVDFLHELWQLQRGRRIQHWERRQSADGRHRTQRYLGRSDAAPLPYDAATSSSGTRTTRTSTPSPARPPRICQAVGGYVDSSGNQEPLAETETNGIWGLTAGGVAAPPSMRIKPLQRRPRT